MPRRRPRLDLGVSRGGNGAHEGDRIEQLRRGAGRGGDAARGRRTSCAPPAWTWNTGRPIRHTAAPPCPRPPLEPPDGRRTANWPRSSRRAATAPSGPWPPRWPAPASPMGVLPAGTLNHFARDLGMPAALPAAAAALAAALAAGRVRAVDVGEVNGRVFVNNSSIGLYPRIVARRDRQLRRWRRERPTPAAGLRPGRRRSPCGWAGASGWRCCWRPLPSSGATPPLRSRSTPATGTDLPAHAVRLRRQQLLPHRPVQPRRAARLDAGELCLYAARRAGRFGLLRLALRAAFGRLRRDADFAAMTVPSCGSRAGARSCRSPSTARWSACIRRCCTG